MPTHKAHPPLLTPYRRPNPDPRIDLQTHLEVSLDNRLRYVTLPTSPHPRAKCSEASPNDPTLKRRVGSTTSWRAPIRHHIMVPLLIDHFRGGRWGAEGRRSTTADGACRCWSSAGSVVGGRRAVEVFCEDGMIGILFSHGGEEGLTFEEVGALAGSVLCADGLAVETLCREALYTFDGQY